jgi:simple sugar transport system permease protein
MLDQILTIGFMTGFLAATMRMMVPILVTALGETISERSGIMNLGIEGIMILGAFAGFYSAFTSGSLLLGFLMGGLAGLLLGVMMGVASVRFQANQIVAGVGIWIFCQGLSSFLNRSLFGVVDTRPSLTTLQPITFPYLAEIPIIGEVLFNQDLFVYLVLLSVPLLEFVFRRTSWGISIDTVGEHPRAGDAAGLKVGLIRYLCVSLGGFLAGLGGAYLTLGLYGLYTNDLSIGLGWMAIAVVVFGKWRPWGIVGGAAIFGAAKALQFRLQAMNFPLPYQFLLMMPFVVTLLFVIFFVRGESGPSALTKPYLGAEQ